MDRGLGDAGDAGQRDHVADGEDLRVSGERAVARDQEPTGGPDDRARVDAPDTVGVLDDVDAGGVDVGRADGGLDIDAEVLQGRAGIALQGRGERAEDRGCRVEQQDPGAGGVDGAELGGQDPVGEDADLAGELHAGGPGSDDREREPCVALGGRVGLFGHLERAEHVAAQPVGVIEGLHARGEALPFVVSEVGVGGSRGDDQGVVGHLDPVLRDAVHDAAAEVEAVDLGRRTRTLGLPRNMFRNGGAICPGDRTPVPT